MNIILIAISIFVTLIFLYLFFRFIQDQNLKHLAKDYEEYAIHCQNKIINNPHQINVSAEKMALKIMKKRYLQLKNNFKDNPRVLKEIAKDWRDYVHAIFEFMSEKEVFEIDFGDHLGDSAARDRFKKRVAASMIKKDKIEERFCRLLGISDISIKYIKLYRY